ncbi:MAG: hypothetical protein QM564_10575 [Bergeyella sp.]
METVTLKINKRTKAGKAFKEMLDVVYSKQKGIEIIEEKSPYSLEFVKKIKRAEKQKGIIVDTKDIWGSLGLK